MVGIILAAGDGVRFSSSTGYDCCKVLNKVNNKPLIQYSLDNLVSLGISECVIVVGSFAERIKECVTDNYRGIKISYVVQRERKGLVNALMCAVDIIDNAGNIVVLLADEIFVEFDAACIRAIVEKADCDFLCGIVDEENKDKIKGNFSVETDADMNLLRCIEKPAAVENNSKGTGFYMFNNACLELLIKSLKQMPEMLYDLCDYMNYLVSFGKKGLCVRVAKREFNINTYEEFREAEAYFS